MRIKEGYILYESSGNNMVLGRRSDGRGRGILRLNSTGVTLWKLLEGGTTPAALTARLCSDFDIEPDIAKADVKAFLASLIKAGVLEE